MKRVIMRAACEDFTLLVRLMEGKLPSDDEDLKCARSIQPFYGVCVCVCVIVSVHACVCAFFCVVVSECMASSVSRYVCVRV